MKILFVDTNLSGHHMSYMQTLTNNCRINMVYLLPFKPKELPGKVYTHKFGTQGKKSFFQYSLWLFCIRKIVKKENIDLIHFLYSDSMYRYAGSPCVSIVVSRNNKYLW
jgi:hypothetical protein